MSNTTDVTKPQVGDTWYRYEDKRYGTANEFGDVDHVYVKLQMTDFKVTKVTPKGVWVSAGGWCAPRFVLLAANKRYAAPSKEEALASLLARKARQMRILETQLGHAKSAVVLAQLELATLAPPAPAPAAVAVELVEFA